MTAVTDAHDSAARMSPQRGPASPLKSAQEVLFMNIFYRPKYHSDVTQFIAQLKAKNPELEARQRQGRELLWDKTVDRSAWSEYRKAQIEQKPYVYQTDSK